MFGNMTENVLGVSCSFMSVCLNIPTFAFVYIDFMISHNNILVS